MQLRPTPRLTPCLAWMLAAGGCFAELRSDPPDMNRDTGAEVAATDTSPDAPSPVADAGPGADAPSADSAPPAGDCPAGQLKCGTTCHQCCANPDCPGVANADPICASDRTCSYRCRTDFERCRGRCDLYPKVLGVCLAAAGDVTAEVYWCDSDEAGERLLKWRLNVQQAMQLGLDAADPGVLDKACLASANGMLGTYCTSGPFVAGRVSRMDTAFIYSGTLDGDGRLVAYHRTPGTGSRTCQP
jgi:hypothetical protein